MNELDPYRAPESGAPQATGYRGWRRIGYYAGQGLIILGLLLAGLLVWIAVDGILHDKRHGGGMALAAAIMGFGMMVLPTCLVGGLLVWWCRPSRSHSSPDTAPSGFP